MPPTYSNDLKWRIIYLQTDGYSRKKISEILYVSVSLVNKVLRLYRKWGTVTNPWKKVPGRHKTFDRNDMNVGINNIQYVAVILSLYIFFIKIYK